MTPTELGTTIREYRERAGLTQDGLGRLIAVDPDLIDQWEWGEQAPGDGDAERISEVLGIPSAQLRDSDVAVEISPDVELVVIEIMAAAPVPSSPAPRRPVEPRAMIEVPSIWHRLRDAATSDPTRAAWVSAVLLVAVIAVIFVVVVLGTGSAPSTTSFGSSTTAGERGEAEVLREQRDRLIVRVDELTEELEQAEDRAAAAEAEALRLDGVDERNTRLEAENELLRKAVVVSSAGDDVQAVALTLDAGDSADAVAAALDTLETKGASASFFPSGLVVDAEPDLWRRAVEEGHELGNATMRGVPVTSVNTATLRDDLRAWETTVSDVLGTEYRATWFRPPFMEGFTDRIGPEVVRTVVAEVGMATALWSVDPYWALFAPNGPRVAGEGPGAADIAAYVVDAAGPGSIVHLSAESLDVEALPAIIDGLRSKGLEPTTLTGLFEMQDRQLEGDIVLDGDRPAA